MPIHALKQAVVGIVTSREWANLTPDDRPLIHAFARRGLEAMPTVWDDESSWSACTAFVVRSVWDYHTRPLEFTAWLDRIESRGTLLCNSAALMRWNMHKRYLLDLAAKGIDIPDTMFLARGTEVDLDAIIRRRGWMEAVIKPAVSASARLTYRSSELSRNACDALVAEHDVIVQELLREIFVAGEWSVVFIDGDFSHSFLKRARDGEFRVQSEFGGSIVVATPPDHVIAACEKVAAALPAPCTYARIDGVVMDQRFILLEAECIEPELQLGMRPGSYDRLVAAVARQLAPAR